MKLDALAVLDHPDLSGRLQSLPSPPVTLVRIVRETGDSEGSAHRVVDLNEAEPAFTVDLLRLANSALNTRGAPVRSVRQATLALGSRTVRNAAVAHVLRQLTTRMHVGHFDTSRFWEDSLRRATAARVLAEDCGYEDPSEAATVGLLQDLGTLFTAALAPGRSDELAAASASPASNRCSAEVAIVGESHAALFARVATQWSLPGDLVQAIEHHHNPRPPIEDRRVQRLCAIARCADAVADVFQAKARGRTVLLADEALATLGARRRITLRETANRVLDLMPTEAKDASIVIGEQTGFEDLLTAVARSLVGIAEQYEDVLQRLERTLLEKSELARLLERRNAELQRLAAMDALTGVANRRRFFEAAEEAMRGGGAPISVQMLDLDHFKAINDRLGHAAGDEVLREVAKRLCLAVRPGDLVGRLGGEEFAVLMPGCRPADALRVAERCRTAISSRPVQIPDLGEQVAVTASFGIAGTADATQTLATLLQHADRNQYESKRAGRNRVTG